MNDYTALLESKIVTNLHQEGDIILEGQYKEAYDAMMDAYEQAPMAYALFGHLGDNHLHLNLLPKTADELATARAFYVDLARKAVALGGSVSGEHGIGKTKKNQLAIMLAPETLEAFRALKRHLDPANVLGRGTMFDV